MSTSTHYGNQLNITKTCLYSYKILDTGVQHYSFLINCLPISIIGHKSPYEIVFGSPPTYDSLSVLKCLCYPLLTPFGRSKLEYKSIRYVFLRYLVNHKGYWCFEPQTGGHIYISRHVKFNELQFPCRCDEPLVHPIFISSKSLHFLGYSIPSLCF